MGAGKEGWASRDSIDGSDPERARGPASDEGPVLNISAVERDTGLPKDTLRAWERRYGFPRPARGACGERMYSVADLDRLRLLRRLIDAGYRPGKVIGQPLEALNALVGRSLPGEGRSGAAGNDDVGRCLALASADDVDGLRGALSQAVARLGLQRFVVELAAPLDQRVVRMQVQGQLELYEASLYAESMQVVLRQAIASLSRGRRPRVLLTSLPRQDNVRALLMVEAMLVLHGCRCLSLGVQTPLADIADAARALSVDIVGLSFSSVPGPHQARESLLGLRARLSVDTELWAGGPCSAQLRRPSPGVRMIEAFDGIARELERWRSARPG